MRISSLSILLLSVVLSASAQPVSIISSTDNVNDVPIDVAYAIGDLPVYVGSHGMYQDSAVIACLNSDGSTIA